MAVPPPPSPPGESVTWKVNSPCFKSSCAYYNSLNWCKYWQIYLELNSIERLYRSSGKEKESRCLASRSPQNVKLSRLLHSRSDAKKCTKKCDVRAELLLCLSIQCFHSRGQHLCKFIGTKESVYIRKEFNSHRTSLGHQHGRRFIVLERKYGRHDVMWKQLSTTIFGNTPLQCWNNIAAIQTNVPTMLQRCVVLKEAHILIAYTFTLNIILTRSFCTCTNDFYARFL